MTRSRGPDASVPRRAAAPNRGRAPGVAGPPTRREQKKTLTRRRILKCAWREFAERDIDAVSMEDIARGAGVARGTLFNYFPSKGEVVRALVADTIGAFVRTIEDSNSRYATVGARMNYSFDEAARLVVAGGDLSRRLLRPGLQAGGSALDDPASAGLVMRAYVKTFTTAVDGPGPRRMAAAADFAEISISTFTGLVAFWRIDTSYPLRRKARRAASMLARLVEAESSGAPGRRLARP